MAAILFFCLPLLFIANIASSKNKAAHLLVYGIGILMGVILLFTFSWFNIVFDRSTASLSIYWLTYAIVHTLVPSFLCMCLYMLFSFPFSSKVIIFFPSLVCGLFTLQLYAFIFTYSASIHALPIIFHIIIYASAVLVFDAVITLVVSAAGFFSGLFIFCGTILIGFYAYTLWYFNTNVFFSYLIFTLMPLISLGLHFFCIKRVLNLQYNNSK